MMGLFQKAYETYETHRELAGVLGKTKEPLAPIAHIITSAKIEIELDRNGHLIRVIAVGKDEPKIIIPVTEESSGRTSGICPHPLCDQVGYLSPANPAKYDAYVKQLTAWSESEYAHPMLKPILAYVMGKTLPTDLAEAGMDHASEKDMVRWTVIGVDDKDSPNCWKNRSLFHAFAEYYASIKAEDEPILCMVSGKSTAGAQQHLKGIISINGNAKLISANDTANFTYRGRFKTDDQAATVGYEASQKAHNALKWLVADQGVNVAGRTFLCWNPKGKLLPQPHLSILRRSENQIVKPTQYKKELAKALLSYKANLDPSDDAVIAVFDAATTGRLAVTYYSEQSAKDFLENLRKWDDSCCFVHNRFGTEAPALERIINCAFGAERNGRIEADPRVVKQHMQRLLICRVDGGAMPYDIVHAIAQKTMRPQAYEASLDYLQFTACAVIRKFYLDHYKEEYVMALEKEKKDISYQYGRLLAVLEKAERDTYTSNEGREPNAIRMQSVFCTRPAQTAKIIIEQLKKGYLPRLSQGLRIYYDQLIGEIYEKISAFPDNQWNAPLKETYIMGYYLQKNALYTKNTDNNETEESENE